MKQRGDWPYVDLVLVKDYEDPDERWPRCAFRIHLDIPVEDADVASIESSLKEKNLAAVFNKLVKKGLREQDNPRAWATLKGALGQK